jgi:hypothetical protein
MALLPGPGQRRIESEEARCRRQAIDRLGEGFVHHVEAFVLSCAQQYLTAFLVDAPQDWIWNPKGHPQANIKISWRPQRQSSWGWYKGISIALNGVFSLDHPGDIFLMSYYGEYTHISKDPEIGSFRSNDWHPRLAALVAHEVAHQIHQCGRFQSEPDRQAHGLSWQRIYRQLRTSRARR